MPSNPALSKTSGITFWVAPPSVITPSSAVNSLIDDNLVQHFFDNNNASGSGIQFTDDLGRFTLPG